MVTTLPLDFGAANNAKIRLLAYPHRVRFQVFFLLCKLLLGLTVLVVQTLRTDAEQAALHKADPRNPASPGDHGKGWAADLNFYRNGVLVLVKATPAAKWAPVYALAAICGISNGSKFTGYPDNNHFYRRSAL